MDIKSIKMGKKKKKKEKELNQKKKVQKKEKKPISKKLKKSSKKREEKKEKKGILKRKKLIVFLILIFFLGVVPLGLYFFSPLGSPLGNLMRPIIEKIPYPIAMVGDRHSLVYSSDMILNTDAMKKFYESQDYARLGLRVDFSTPEGKMRLRIKEKDALDKLVENEIIKRIANRHGIQISEDESRTRLAKEIRALGDKDELELDLESLWGWTLDDFFENVVLPQHYVERLFVLYEGKIEETNGYQKILKAKNEIIDTDKSFSEIVKKYSEGESVENEGALGWFEKEQMIPEVANAVFGMKPGEISDIIVSPLGFHIVLLEKIEEKKGSELSKEEIVIKEKGDEGDEEETVKRVKIRQVFVRGEGFLEWLKEEKKKEKVMIFMKDYTWNEEAARVEFRSAKMRRVEKELRIKSEGDPSLL